MTLYLTPYQRQGIKGKTLAASRPRPVATAYPKIPPEEMSDVKQEKIKWPLLHVNVRMNC